MGTFKRFAASFFLAGGLSVGLASVPGCGGDGETRASACGSATGLCQINLTLIHTSDIHSRLLPFEQVITQIDADLGLGSLDSVANVGGVARMAYVIGRERARSERVLHLDSGDCFQGAPIFNFYAGEPEVRSLSTMGIDAAVIGNHEFDRGALNAATQFQRWANFGVLASNYKFETQDYPNSGRMGTVSKPFQVYNQGGLKIAVIGMANLSSLTSIFDQPNRSGITPLNTAEVAQFYVDLLRPHVDFIVMLTHLGLEIDQRMVRSTTGIDVVLGGHNHVVINPPQQITDCSADTQNPGFIWVVDPNAKIDTAIVPPDDPDPALKGPAGNYDPDNRPFQVKRACKPRRVIIAHSGAFAKYVGRLDLILSNDPALVSPTGDPADYDKVNGFELLSNRYQAFPIDDRVPEDPVMVDMLQPYRRGLDVAADLDILVGYSPDGARRIASNGGDSPLGNLVATGMWLRLGVQSDFSLTNSTGVRADINPGPITIEQMYNVFPFDNSITKMQLSGLEVQEMFDFSARRAASRGCTTQAQIAGARVRFNCAGCQTETDVGCTTDEDCAAVRGTCDAQKKRCVVGACAEEIYIGHARMPCTGTEDGCVQGTKYRRCKVDEECSEADGKLHKGQCDRSGGREQGICLSRISKTNLYELATSTYLAGGGSGFRVLQRNTTQIDTKIQQRDALTDFLRQGKPCGYNPSYGPDGLKACSRDADCDASFVCACPGTGEETGSSDPDAFCRTRKLEDGTSATCDDGKGRCVRTDCRSRVASFHTKSCAGTRAQDRDQCRAKLNACSLAGEECKILSCVDASIGNYSDGRVEMIGR